MSLDLLLLRSILLDICLPIFVLIGIGWCIDRKFRLDIHTLVKLNIYLFVPAFIFVNVSQSSLSGSEGGRIVLFTLCIIAAMFLLGGLASFLCRGDREAAVSMRLTSMFYNCGNYGIPLTTLAFPGFGPPVQVFVLMTMNLATFSIGLLLVSDNQNRRLPLRRRFLPILRQPAVYTISLALLVRNFDVPVQNLPFLWEPLEYISRGLVGLALLTLGVQLSQCSPPRLNARLSLGLLSRLALGPLIAVPLTWLFGFNSSTSAVLILTAGAPTAVNVALLAYEFKADARFAASMVFYSTLFSILSVTLNLMLLRLLMPLSH